MLLLHASSDIMSVYLFTKILAETSLLHGKLKLYLNIAFTDMLTIYSRNSVH